MTDKEKIAEELEKLAQEKQEREKLKDTVDEERTDDPEVNKAKDDDNKVDVEVKRTSDEENPSKTAQLEEELQLTKEKLLRKAAEFENYKKRTEVEQMNLLKYSGEGVINRLLPVIDDFERSLKHIKDAKEIDSIKTGINMVYEKLMKTLGEMGVQKIDAKGEPFNVDFHEAVMQQPSEDAEPETVLEEVETGYMYKDRVIRHSKVIVADQNSSKKNEE